jgi:hypothetical protein
MYFINSKLQVPTSREILNSKFQTFARRQIWELENWSFSGAWLLGFEISSRLFLPCPYCPFAWRFLNRLGCHIAKRKQDVSGFGLFAPRQFAERGAKGFQAEIVFAFTAFYAIEEGGDVNELVPRVQKIEVENFLPCHNISMLD